MNDKQLNLIRQEIDKIDYQLHDLMNLRAKKALDIGKLKLKSDPHLTNFYRPQREAEVLQQIVQYNKGPLSPEAIAHIFRVIMKECLDLQIKTFKAG